MLRSMYSGISGMKNSQIKLDTIGNNIANVNTFGFKKGRTTFSDMVSQELSGATAPVAGGRGGVNATQVGLGMQLASIDTIHTQGSLQNTSRALDLGISGDGYFVVTDGDAEYYTRAGNFYLDAAGNLVNSSGLQVLGEDRAPINFIDIAGDLDNIKSFSIGADGSINIINAEGELIETDVQIGLAKFPNAEGLAKAGENLFVTTPNSGVAAELTTPGANGTGTLVAGTLEMSNVDLSEEFTEMIVAQRGFQANTRIITTSDDILQELINLKR
ncbi:flagellar basal body rod protein FlgG [Alkalihalobacillus alcalophilus ATCC 27647 = CGMCC 1.3604]|uniref:Flagellar hook protein FlgE n=1 Tax=Alkalihalobacillus alcalophilus ATCC 27647 = CGMCC 1.3604 TaxID=1218173 RepID=A0A094XHL8_ALKAL|nr:flagellar basal body rod protein FlgG [Alkalihalobacillus alcalophilus]KGA98245.1 flagellar basal body rod protein FlgG [Alkalihalobacillus alcalophilus ATCC 27647 = CGMCC 1.3604]MED1562184.1 flagellar basal body rod protein FlgG [Alkalihalobacillus alcalophilus]THG91409.1 flagellar basal body rod protein FlgG [Alkalihalobacillus alcalophilus ATCC 27647 = CGMCC 1.3604]